MRSAHQPDGMPGYQLPRYAYRRPPELSGGKDAGLYPVIVVGAGLGGLTAALELASRGVPVVVLDDDDTVGASGLSSRGICYAKRSLEILERFGAASRIRAKGVTWNEGDVFRGEERLYRFNLQPETDQRFPAFVNLQQFYVEQYLVEALKRYPSADLRWKNKVLDVTQGSNHAELKVQTPDGKYSLRARYVIGADGAHSIVRKKVGARDAESALFDTAWCIADVKIKASEAPVRKAFLDNKLNDGGAIWYHQMADGVWRTDWQISHYKDPDAEATPARAKKRLRKLLGPKVKFELVWVGAWRFRRRWLERMIHGRVLFLGDAAAQHSPFGARGGNRAIQDANNLGWKLALVLGADGNRRAHPDLLQTYEDERHPAAREAVEIASRSAIFIGPESGGQRLFRDAVLDLAQRHPWARELVNVGRLSVASNYAGSPLNAPDADFNAPLAMPGAAAPDGRLEKDFLAEKLQGQFSVVYFGNRGPTLQVQTLHVKNNKPLFKRYGVPKEGATYVFRPDGHVLARCRGVAGEFARASIEKVLNYRNSKAKPATLLPASIHDRDRLYDAFSDFYDSSRDKERALARLVTALAHFLPADQVREIVTAASAATAKKRR